MNLDRRDGIRLLGLLTATALGPGPDLDALERVARAVALPQRVDAQVIDHIDTMVTACRKQEDALGPLVVLSTMLSQRDMIDELLRGCHDAARPRLRSLYGRASISLAYYVFGLGDSARAARYCEDARKAGHEAGDTALVIYTLCSIADYATDDSRHDVATDAAAAAQRLVRACGDEHLRAFVGETVATCYGITGSERQCMAAFEQARHALDSGTGGTGSETSHAYWFTEGVLRSNQSASELRFGRTELAAASAIAGLDLLDVSATGDRASCLLRLADARLRGGELEEATRLVADTADLATRYRSPRFVTTLHAARNRMTPWKDTPAVRELDQRLADLDLIVPAAV